MTQQEQSSLYQLTKDIEVGFRQDRTSAWEWLEAQVVQMGFEGLATFVEIDEEKTQRLLGICEFPEAFQNIEVFFAVDAPTQRKCSIDCYLDKHGELYMIIVWTIGGTVGGMRRSFLNKDGRGWGIMEECQVLVAEC